MESAFTKIGTVNKSLLKLQKQASIVDTLENLHSSTAIFGARLETETMQLKYYLGRYLGTLKCFLDTLPPHVARKQKINDVPIDIFIKTKVDENVMDILDREHPAGTLTDYFPGGVDKYVNDNQFYVYVKLLDVICGYRGSKNFNQKNFSKLFPDSVSKFVTGFASAYNEMFVEICAAYGKQTSRTDYLREDIWKNWLFFFSHGCYEYRLDGKYIDQMSRKPLETYEPNKDLYYLLQSRAEEHFQTLNISMLGY